MDTGKKTFVAENSNNPSSASNSSAKTSSNASSSAQETNSKKTKTDLEILNSAYLNAEMGKNSVNTILDKINDHKLKTLLLSHYEKYDDIANKIAGEIVKNGETPKKSNAFTNAMLWGNIQVSTLINSKPCHIAEMMINGNNMGIISLNKDLNSLGSKISDDTKKVVQDLLTLEQSNLEQLKVFL